MTIYFIQEVDNPEGNIKIGYTGNSVKGRLKQIQYQSPVPLQILKSLDGDMAYEQAIHQHFADIRVSGEWFKPTCELLGYIESPFPLKPKVGDGIRIHRGYNVETDRLLFNIFNGLNDEGQLAILNYAQFVWDNAEDAGES